MSAHGHRKSFFLEQGFIHLLAANEQRYIEQNALASSLHQVTHVHCSLSLTFAPDYRAIKAQSAGEIAIRCPAV